MPELLMYFLIAVIVLLASQPVKSIYFQGTDSYDPATVDWRSVITACRESCSYEKRLCNFYIRTAFHDSMSVTCLDGGACGGADGSLPLSLVEQIRPENAQFLFSKTASIALTAIASWYNASVADVMAVCGAVAAETLGGPTIISPLQKPAFLVGRKDRLEPNPESQLPSQFISPTQLDAFARARGLTVDDLIVLLGTHSLIQTQGCRTPDFGFSHWCNPYTENCADKVQMFRWSSRWYIDACTPTIMDAAPPPPPPTSTRLTGPSGTMSTAGASGWPQAEIHQAKGDPKGPSSAWSTTRAMRVGLALPPEEPAAGVAQLPGGKSSNTTMVAGFNTEVPRSQEGPAPEPPEVASLDLSPVLTSVRSDARGQELCKFTNPKFIEAVRRNLTANESVLGTEPAGIIWTNNGCQARALPEVLQNCPHEEEWFYPKLDADLGRICQLGGPLSLLDTTIRAAMREYIDLEEWNSHYITSYILMVNTGTNFVRNRPLPIDGTECPSGFRSRDPRAFPDMECQRTSGVASPEFCMCGTEMRRGHALRLPPFEPLPAMTPQMAGLMDQQALARSLMRDQAIPGCG